MTIKSIPLCLCVQLAVAIVGIFIFPLEPRKGVPRRLAERAADTNYTPPLPDGQHSAGCHKNVKHFRALIVYACLLLPGLSFCNERKYSAAANIFAKKGGSAGRLTAQNETDNSGT